MYQISLYENMKEPEGRKISEYSIYKVFPNFVITQNDKGYFGIARLDNKNIGNSDIIKPKYWQVFDFVDGFAIVTIGETSVTKYGLINDQGVEVVPPIYQSIEKKEYGYLVQKDEEFGILSPTGEVLIEPKYKSVVQLAPNIFSGKINQQWQLIDINGRVLNPKLYSYINPFEGDIAIAEGDYKEYLITIDGLLFPNQSYTKLESHGNGNYTFKDYNKERQGVIDKTGEVIVKPKYLYVKYIGDNRLLVVTPHRYKRKIIDYSGKTIKNLNGSLVSGKYIDIREARIVGHSLIGALIIGSRYLMNTDGDILSRNYYKIHDFEDGFAIVESNNFYGLINETGQEVLKLQYTELERIGKGIYLLTKFNDNMIYNANTGYLSNNHTRTTSLKNMFLSTNDHLEDILINEKGEELVNFGNCLAVSDNGNETFKVLKEKQNKENCYEGLYDKTGKTIFEPIFSYISYFEDGLATICLNDKWGIVDSKGNVIVPLKYDWSINSKLSIKGNLITVKHSYNNYSLFNKKGEEIFNNQTVEEFHIVNDEQVIMNNKLCYIESIKCDYKLDFIHFNDITTKNFSSLKEREEYLDKLYKLLKEEVTAQENLFKNIMELLSKEESNAHVNVLATLEAFEHANNFLLNEVVKRNFLEDKIVYLLNLCESMQNTLKMFSDIDIVMNNKEYMILIQTLTSYIDETKVKVLKK